MACADGAVGTQRLSFYVLLLQLESCLKVWASLRFMSTSQAVRLWIRSARHAAAHISRLVVWNVHVDCAHVKSRCIDMPCSAALLVWVTGLRRCSNELINTANGFGEAWSGLSGRTSGRSVEDVARCAKQAGRWRDEHRICSCTTSP